MKTRYVFILICLTGFLLVTCNKDKNETTATETQTTPLQAGQILTYSFAVDNDTVLKMRDEVIDYGFANFPVLMLVHKETLIHQPGWGSVFHPLIREKLDTVLGLWAQEFLMNNVTAQEKAYVARHFQDFIVSHNLDAGVFVDLVLWHHGSKLAPLLGVVLAAEISGKSPNDCLYDMLQKNIPPETVLSQLKSGDQWIFIAAMMFSLNVIVTSYKLVDIILGNDPVVDYKNNYMSYVCLDDTILSDYTGGTQFTSRSYHLSYDVGLWEAKCTYHIEGTYGASSPVCPGKYLTHCNTIPDEAHAKGPGFVVKGNVTYSPPINTGTFDEPVPEMNGKVQVTYGDCCCFRKFSILNFKINAGTGYKEDTWDTGK